MASENKPSESVREDEVLARLLQSAGRRNEPPAEVYEQTLAVATDAFRRKTRRSGAGRAWQWAAVLLVMAGAVVIGISITNLPANDLASIERIVGTAQLKSHGQWRTVTANQRPIRRDEVLRTGANSFAGLGFGGVSLRVAPSTQLVLESTRRIKLISGTIYIDTGANAQGQSLVEVITPAGTATDIGTQFEVRYEQPLYRLRVREGQVRLVGSGQAFQSLAGDELVIDADGRHHRNSISPSDPEWGWVASIAPDFDGRTVAELLDWVSRETGKEIRYADPGVKQNTAVTVFNTSVLNVAPLETLEVLLATTDYEHTVGEDGTITIRLRLHH
ncbi:MAG: FecR family protein [Xanthomonadales bacterium]|nr:FecR family protein [Xanthomonadales bacterium]